MWKQWKSENFNYKFTSWPKPWYFVCFCWLGERRERECVFYYYFFFIVFYFTEFVEFYSDLCGWPMALFCLLRPTLSLQALLSNFVRSPTPGGVLMVRHASFHIHKIRCSSEILSVTPGSEAVHQGHVWSFCFQRLSSCSEDQPEGDAVQTLWHHHSPQKTGKHLSGYALWFFDIIGGESFHFFNRKV